MEPRTAWVAAAAAPPLRAFIDGYRGYSMTGFPPGQHRGLPSRHLTFIVSIGPSIDVVAQTDERQAPGSYRCVLSGLQARPARIAHMGHQEGVAVKLTPLGCRALFGLPAGALWNTSLECADVTGPRGRELWERLQGPATWSERFAVCDDVLSRMVDTDVVTAPELRHAWQVLVRSGGTAPIGDVAASTGWSRQHLARRFRNEFGLAPKVAARIVRFERAERLLLETPSTTIAAVAASCGYFDQAHLDRDFAALAGCAPSTWLSEEVPIVQDGASSTT